MTKSSQTPDPQEDATIYEEYWQDQHLRKISNLIVYPAGILYLIVCGLLAYGEQAAPEVIGAVCGDQCGGARVFGILLEWYGGGAMALLLLIRFIAQKTLRESLVASAVSLAFIHAGASLVLAGSQWFGFADFCILCQVAALLSLIIAITHVPVAGRAFQFPVITSLQSLALGGFLILASWPLFYGTYGDVIEMERELSSESRDQSGEIIEMADEGESSEGEETAPVEEEDEAAQPQQPRQPAQVGPVLPPGGGVTTTPQTINEAISVLSLGKESAPYTLFILSRMGCPYCQRFESATLPVLVEEAVDSGQLQVQFLYTSFGAEAQKQNMQVVAATALKLGGAPITEAIPHVQEDENVVSIPQMVSSYPDPTVREAANQALRDVENNIGWNEVLREHRNRGILLRNQYLDGSSATPCTVLMETPSSLENLPPLEEVYAFVGYQLPEPYLDFLGLDKSSED